MSYCFVNSLINIFKKYDLKFNILSNDVFLDIKSINHLEMILYFLRDHESCLFKQLTDIVGVDYPENKKRFVLIYCLNSLKYNTRIFVTLKLNELDIIPSIAHIYKSSCFMEREVWDMFGIFFESNPDLRRLLTDYGFEGHPLRKDFPLSGYIEARYDDSQKRVIYEPIEMSQEYRLFSFKSSWE